MLNFFCSLGWSWQSQWRWQHYILQAKIQRCIITNKTYKKWKTSRKQRLIRKTVWRFQNKKNRHSIHDLWKNPVAHLGVNWLSPMNRAFISSKNYTKQNLWKAFKSKLLERGKTRTKKSTPDLFNFFAVLAGHDKVSDAGSFTSCRRKFKDALLQTKHTKNERPPENSVWSGKQFEDFRRKKTNTVFTTFEKTQWHTKESIDWVQWTRPS